MTTYIYQRTDWPNFRWDSERLAHKLAAVRYRQGQLFGRIEAFGIRLRDEAVLHTLTEEAVKSSEIEGQLLNRDQVRSSLARRLGVDIGALAPSDRYVDGVVHMILDAIRNYDTPITRERLFGWHAALFPTGYSGLAKITVGTWRTDEAGPMQIVSGPCGREQVHYEAPAAQNIDTEMGAFIAWFNEGQPDLDPILKAATAHLWFETIHPFDDGNGRIGRALCDMMLARSECSAQRFYSISAQIKAEQATYYEQLEAMQKGDLDITAYLDWFLDCIDRAFDGAATILARVIRKATLWKKYEQQPLNDRQRHMLNLLIDGFEGKLTSSKWAKITKCSQDTAGRDINALVQQNLLKKDPAAGGRSTSYLLVE
jgi:Fic family protein